MSEIIQLKMDRARCMLAEVRDAVGAKRVADFAHAATIAAIRQGATEAAARCKEIEVDALTLEGEFLKRAPKAPGGQPYQGKPTGTLEAPVVSKTRSHW
jgi:hypothetical protein